MKRQYTYFRGNKDKEFATASMKKYVEEKQEIDKFLEKLISPAIQGKNLKILDACCGVGHVLRFLSEISPESTFLGVDQTPYLIEEAKTLCQDKKNIFLSVLCFMTATLILRLKSENFKRRRAKKVLTYSIMFTASRASKNLFMDWAPRTLRYTILKSVLIYQNRPKTKWALTR